MKRLLPGGVMTPLVTPFLKGQVDYAAFDHLVEWQIEEGVEGLVVNSLIGEGPTLSAVERRSLISRAVHISRGRIPIIAATGTCSTETTRQRTLEAEQLGADVALIVQPYYNRPGQKGIIQHFGEVAAATTIPIVIHNDPYHAGVELKPETLRLLLQVPSVIGVVGETWDSSLEIIGKGRSLENAARHFMEDDSVSFERIAGCDGSISAVANICPSAVVFMHRAIRRGDLEQARQMHRKLQSLMKAFAHESQSAVLKSALSCLRGINDGVRLPLTGVAGETAEGILLALRSMRGIATSARQTSLISEARVARADGWAADNSNDQRSALSRQ
ncbi:dihydrodipicolinate synthase family protein [Agrobacterium sp. 22-221-1]